MEMVKQRITYSLLDISGLDYTKITLISYARDRQYEE